MATPAAFAGFAGYLSTTSIDWTLAAAVTAAAVVGSLAGARLAGQIREDLLRKAFGWFVVAMGVLVLARQIPEPLRTNPLLWMVTVAVVLAAAAMPLWHRRRTRLVPVPGELTRDGLPDIELAGPR